MLPLFKGEQDAESNAVFQFIFEKQAICIFSHFLLLFVSSFPLMFFQIYILVEEL